MLNLWPIISNAFVFGVILSGVLFPSVLVLTKINPEIMLKNYPPDVRAKYGPMSERSKRQRVPVAIVIVVIFLGILSLSFRGMSAGGDILFWDALVHLLVMFSVFNISDWLVLDWLIVVTICPRFIVLPGTEGMAGYKDYGLHFRGFVIGMGITLVTSFVVAGIVAALF